jgi:hypothetical protein
MLLKGDGIDMEPVKRLDPGVDDHVTEPFSLVGDENLRPLMGLQEELLSGKQKGIS